MKLLLALLRSFSHVTNRMQSCSTMPPRLCWLWPSPSASPPVSKKLSSPPPSDSAALAAPGSGPASEPYYEDAYSEPGANDGADLAIYLDSIWNKIEYWRENPSAAASQSIPVQEAIYAFEALINVHAGSSEVNQSREIHFKELTSVPNPSGGWSTGTWNGAQAATVYNALVSAINTHLADAGGTGYELAVVDVAIDDSSLAPVLTVRTLTQSTTAATSAPLSVYRWGDESVVPVMNRLSFTCLTSQSVPPLLSIDVSTEYKARQPRRKGRPVAVVVGLVDLNVNATSPAPYIFQRQTYNYPTGSGDYSLRGQYKTHSDRGREELCFAYQYSSYVTDGADLFELTLNTLVPHAQVKIRSRFVDYPREPFESMYVSTGQGVGNPPPNTTSGYERAHKVVTFYGGFVAFLDPLLPLDDHVLMEPEP